MTATAHVAYDWVFVAHVMSAVAAIVVIVVLRVAASTTSTDPTRGRSSFPDRTDWALRLVHVLPLTGFALIVMGSSDVSITHPWVQVGLGCYVVAAAWIEGRVSPLERTLARTLASDNDPRPPALALGRSLDVVLLIFAVAMMTMIVQY